MTLSNVYVQSYLRLPTLLQRIRDEPAPSEFSQQSLKKFGLASPNGRAFVGLLKSLGFLCPVGKPTDRYIEYQDHAKSRQVLGTAILESYKSLFLVEANPLAVDRESIEGIFRNYHDCSDAVAKIMANTFFALLKEADLSGRRTKGAAKARVHALCESTTHEDATIPLKVARTGPSYTIEIHLPSTTNKEVYDAIFQSLRENPITD